MAFKSYCELYVDAALRRDRLVDIIQRETHGVADRHYVDCDWGSFDVRKNDEHSRWKASGEDGFLYYRYIIDVEPRDANQDLRVYIDGLRGLIRSLRLLGAKIVAACDFEDQLS